MSILYASSSDEITLTVDEPQSSGFGPTKYTTYRIVCQSRSGGSSSCRHRFSEFLSLRANLIDTLPGVVVPPLPEKKVLNRFGEEFVEKRRVMLETFLQRSVDHPIVANSSALHSFLQWNETMRAPISARLQTHVTDVLCGRRQVLN